MLSEEELIQAIMKKRKDLTREQLVKMVDEKLAWNPFLTRSGALLIILEEERLSDEILPNRPDYTITEIANLTPGLRRLKLSVRLLGIKHIHLKSGRRLSVMRVGDRTGVASLLLWDEYSDRAKVENFQPGAILSLSNFRAYENKLTGFLELAVDEGAYIVRENSDVELPPLESYFNSVSEALSLRKTIADIKCLLLFHGEEEHASRHGTEFQLVRLVVGDNEKTCPVTLWGEVAEYAKSLRQGETLYLTCLRRDGDGYSSTHRTTIHRGATDTEGLQTALRRLGSERRIKVLYTDGGRVICTDGGESFIITGPAHVKTDDCLRVTDSVVVSWKGRHYLYYQRLERIKEGECTDISPVTSLEDVSQPMRNLVLECVLLRRGQPSTIRTRYGVRPVINLWLGICGRVYPATAWGAKSEEMAKVPEGAKLRILLATVRRNRFDEVEVMLEDDTVVQQLENGFK